MPIDGDELEALLRLAVMPGVGGQRLESLIQTFGSAPAALAAAAFQIRRIPGFGPELARRVTSAGGREAGVDASRARRILERSGAVTITSADPAYPAAFRDLSDPPYVIFAAGALEALSAPAVAIVGTRAPTAYGRAAAERLSADLARSGYAIVSGLARGIDATAHRGALAGRGITIGVLGHGIEQVYPPEHRNLFAGIRERGLLLTDYLPGETPRPGNFPRRNRLIAALSQAVLVVEMGRQSGAQRTVDFALDQGKTVMAVPGPITSAASAGTNQLIKDGARLVTSAEDVIEELRGVGTASPLFPESALHRQPATRQEPELPLLGPEETRVLDALRSEAAHIDQVATTTGLTAGQALAILLDLELRGFVAALPGKRFHRQKLVVPAAPTLG